MTVSGVAVNVVTTAGEQGSDVAAAIAAAINGDANLQALGVFATTEGNAVITNGDITGLDIDDPGLILTPIPTPVPSMGFFGYVGLIGALFVFGSFAVTWQARRFQRVSS